jgi:hypothetical protein
MAAQTQTVISGVDGNLSWAALRSGSVPQGKFQSWNLGIYQVINNITGFDSAGYMEFLGGCKGASWSAVLHHKYNGAAANPLGTTTAAEILPMGGGTATFTVAPAPAACTIAWTAIIQAHGISQDVTGDSVSAISGPCSGTPTLAWDEA